MLDFKELARYPSNLQDTNLQIYLLCDDCEEVRMKKLFIILFLVCSVSANATDLPHSDSQLINAAGVPLFSGGTFVLGNKDLGFRFASSEPPEGIKEWYRKQISGKD